MGKIVWMIDGVIARTRPEHWKRVFELCNELVVSVGGANFKHEVVDPLRCWINVVKPLKLQGFSCVLDLTGWLTPSLRELFPFTPIEAFSLSRMHAVSSIRFDKSGYLLDRTRDEINEVKQALDLSRPLIFDDVGFSGRTARQVMELWGITPKETTYAFLIANAGIFGRQEGAVKTLESLGSKVFFGYELETPEDDGWHLQDFLQTPNNAEEVLHLVTQFQKMISKEGLSSNSASEFLEDETVIRTLFPEALTTSNLIELANEGRFIPLDNFSRRKEMYHAKNPLMWVMPSFVRRTDPGRIVAEKGRLATILRELHSLTSGTEGQREASEEFKRETRRTIAGFATIEGRTMGGKERL